MAVMSLLLKPVVVFRLLYVFGKADRSISCAVLFYYFRFIPFLVYDGFASSGNYPEFEQWVFHIASIFLLLSPAVNPYVYLWRINDIRNGVKRLVKQLLCREN